MNRNQKGAEDNQEQSSNSLGSVATHPPSGPSPEEIEQLVALMRQCCYTGVETCAREIIERFPNFGYAWKMLGTSFLLQKRNEEALASLTFPLKTEPLRS